MKISAQTIVIVHRGDDYIITYIYFPAATHVLIARAGQCGHPRHDARYCVIDVNFRHFFMICLVTGQKYVRNS